MKNRPESAALKDIVNDAATLAQAFDMPAFVNLDDAGGLSVTVRPRSDHFLKIAPEGSCEAHGAMVTMLDVIGEK